MVGNKMGARKVGVGRRRPPLRTAPKNVKKLVLVRRVTHMKMLPKT